MPSGRTLWAELLGRYDKGVAETRELHTRWMTLKPLIDARRHAEVEQRLTRQIDNAVLWRDARQIGPHQFIETG